MNQGRPGKILRAARSLWLLLAAGGLAAALLTFDGSRSSDVAGNLTFFMLVLCLPSSLLGLVAMFMLTDWLSAHGLQPYSHRVALACVWALFAALGAAQWFGLPAIWSRLRPRV